MDTAHEILPDVTRPTGAAIVFTFGDPEPVLDARDYFGMMENRWTGRWFEPPYSFRQLDKLLQSGPHHASAIRFKRNQLMASFQPSQYLSRREFGAFALDYLAFGNGCLEAVPGVLGGTVQLRRLPMLSMRRGRTEADWMMIEGLRVIHEWRGQVLHLMETDLRQEVYGVPEYLGGLQSMLLAEAATLFRRKYFANGSHAGYILHLDGQFDEESLDNIREQLRQSKGPGNFRNVLIHSTGTAKEAVKIIPISEVAAKDDFLNIKTVARDDILAAHRVPPQLLGVVPQTAGGFGDVSKATDAFWELEIVPLQLAMMELNELAGVPAVRFRPRGPQGLFNSD